VRPVWVKFGYDSALKLYLLMVWQCGQIGQNFAMTQHCSYICDNVTRLGKIWLWHSTAVIFVTVWPDWAKFGYDTALQLYLLIVWQCNQIGLNLAMTQHCSYICDNVTRLGEIWLWHSTAVIFVTVRPDWVKFGYGTALQLYLLIVWQCDQIDQNLAMTQHCSYILLLKWKDALA
jgi:hypothetical protein